MLTKSEVAKELDISASTLLRYCRAGTLPQPKRHPVNGWRLWSEEDLRTMRVRLNEKTPPPADRKGR